MNPWRPAVGSALHVKLDVRYVDLDAPNLDRQKRTGLDQQPEQGSTTCVYRIRSRSHLLEPGM